MFMQHPRLNHATGFFHGPSPMILGGARCAAGLPSCASIEQMNREGCTWSMGATPVHLRHAQVHRVRGRPAVRNTAAVPLRRRTGARQPRAVRARPRGHARRDIRVDGKLPPHLRAPREMPRMERSLVGHPLPRHRGAHRGRRPQRRAARRAGRGDLARAAPVRGLPQRQGAHRSRARRRRLVLQRRPRLHGRRGAHPHQRAQEGDHHPRRREHLRARDRR